MDLDDNENNAHPNLGGHGDVGIQPKGSHVQRRSMKTFVPLAQHGARDGNGNANRPHSADDTDTDIVQLRHLASEAAHATYADLQALLTRKLPAANNEQRRQLIYDFVVKARLLLARLLGATRWAATYANAAANANRCELSAMQRINTLDDTADDLWAARRRVVESVRPPVSIQEAINVLANGSSNNFPHVVRSAAGINANNTPASSALPTKDAQDTDVVMVGATSTPTQLSPHARISLGTRRALREALPAVPRVKVLDWNAPPACVRVGIPHLWSADLMLDALDINAAYGLNGKSANFRCFRISLLLNADPDAPTSSATAPTTAPVPPSGRQNGACSRGGGRPVNFYIFHRTT